MLGTALGSLLKDGSDLEALGHFLPCHRQRNDLYENGRKGGRRKSQLLSTGSVLIQSPSPESSSLGRAGLSSEEMWSPLSSPTFGSSGWKLNSFHPLCRVSWVFRGQTWGEALGGEWAEKVLSFSALPVPGWLSLILGVILGSPGDCSP